MMLFFFFSSRRRHTRCGRDWSSDVCSSDLGHDAAPLRRASPLEPRARDGADRRLRTCRDRKSVVKGKSVDLGGRRIIKKKKKKKKKQKNKTKKNKTTQKKNTKQ